MRGVKRLLDPQEPVQPRTAAAALHRHAAVTRTPGATMKDDTFSKSVPPRASCRAPPPSARSRRRRSGFARAQSKRIVVRDDGGIYNKAYGAVFYRPFTQTTGIEVVGVQANAEPIAQIKTHGRHQELHLGHGQDQPAGDRCCSPRGGKSISRSTASKPIRSIADDPGAVHVALRRRHQYLHDRARLSHRRVQGPQGADLLGRFLEREGFPGPPRRAQAPVRHASSRR